MVAVRSIVERNNNARDSITTETDSTNSDAASRAVAAEPAPGSTGGTVRILFHRREQELQRWFDPRCPGGFAVIGTLGFHVLEILVRFPAFLDETIE